jgi:hypothetical protein
MVDWTKIRHTPESLREHAKGEWGIIAAMLEQAAVDAIDAERYRWLRKCELEQDRDCHHPGGWLLECEELDKVIDDWLAAED